MYIYISCPVTLTNVCQPNLTPKQLKHLLIPVTRQGEKSAGHRPDWCPPVSPRHTRGCRAKGSQCVGGAVRHASRETVGMKQQGGGMIIKKMFLTSHNLQHVSNAQAQADRHVYIWRCRRGRVGRPWKHEEGARSCIATHGCR